MNCQVVILAGGLGTRVKEFTESIPKALIPILGVPFLQHQLDQLAREGIDDIVLSVGYRASQIQDFVDTYLKKNPKLSIQVVDEGDQLRGTAGALRFCADKGVLQPDFFILYGDSYLPTSFSSVWSVWKSHPKSSALMTVFRNEGSFDQSNVIFDENKKEIVLYQKKAPPETQAKMRHIDYGLTILKKDVLCEYVQSNAVADLAGIFEDLSRKSLLCGFEIGERFYEIGSYDGIRDLESFLKNRGSQHVER